MNYQGIRYDNRYQNFVGWDKFATWSDPNVYFFSRENMDYLSSEITRRLINTGRTIKVSDEVIGNVMSNVALNNNPIIGDIYTRYIVPNSQPRNDIASLNEQTITVIVNTIMDEIETTRLNQRLSVWSTVYGDFNPEGLRAHSIIRHKENDYIKGVFSMNY